MPLFGEALFGEELFGPPAVPMRITSVLIGGVEWVTRCLLDETEIVHESDGRISTAQITVTMDPAEHAIVGSACLDEFDLDYGLVPQLEIIIEGEEAARLFAGSITRIEPTRESPDIYRYRLACQDYSRLLDSVTIESEVFTSESDETIIDYLFATYLPEVNTDDVVGVMALSLELQDVTLRQALEKIAERTDAPWRLDFNKRLQYHPVDANAAPFGFSDEPDDSTTFGALHGSVTAVQDFSAPANRVIVIGKGAETTSAVFSDEPPAAGDVGSYGRAGTGWPPPATVVSEVVDFRAIKSNTGGGGYNAMIGMCRFDTSSIPDSATIVSATLKLFGNFGSNADSGEWGIEYYSTSNWPIDAGDYTVSAPATCDALPYQSLAIAMGIIGNWFSFPLSNISSISKTGYTGFRLHIKLAGTPTGSNVAGFGGTDGSNPPVLEVAYSTSTAGASGSYDHIESQTLYGILERRIVDRSILTDAEADLRAEAEAARYAMPQVSVSLQFRRDGLNVGDYVPLTYTAEGIDGSYLVKRLAMQWETPDMITYTADLGVIQPEVSEILRRLRAG